VDVAVGGRENRRPWVEQGELFGFHAGRLLL
jgi:hypothetical protein